MNKVEEAFILDSLEDIYGVMRKVQANHDNSELTAETKCIGAGNCCNIGLVVPLLECFNIAKNIRREYWFRAETEGQLKADKWYQRRLSRLYDAFSDDKWELTNETTGRKCSMWDADIGGCSIYRYRPLICRAYGTITPVEPACPRGRTKDGTVIIFSGEEIDNTIDRFETVLKKYYEVSPANAYSVYMPLGVLKFLLPEDDFKSFMEDLEDRFKNAHEGYPHQMRKKEVEVSIK